MTCLCRSLQYFSLMFTVCCLLFAVYYLLFIVYCLLFTVYYLLFMWHCGELESAVHWMWHSSSIGHKWLHIMWCTHVWPLTSLSPAGLQRLPSLHGVHRPECGGHKTGPGGRRIWHCLPRHPQRESRSMSTRFSLVPRLLSSCNFFLSLTYFEERAWGCWDLSRAAVTF